MRDEGQPSGAPRPCGRPRSEHCRAAALRAAADVMAEVPYREVTIEGIAERAGVSKQTIYKWWRSREALCMDAYAELIRGTLREPEGASTRERLVSVVADACRLLREGNNACIAAGFIAEAQSDAEIAASLRALLVAPRRRSMEAVIAAGVRDGEIRPDVDVAIVLDMMLGPIWYRLLLRSAPLDDAFAEQLVNHLWASIRKERG